MDGVDRDYSIITFTEQEAVEKAAQFDPDFRFGTKTFRRHTKKEIT
jgi:hypothetical protein